MHIATALQRKKTETAENTAKGATENSTGSIAVLPETTEISTSNQQSASISDESARRSVSVNRGASKSENGVQRASTNESSDLYDRVNFLFLKQQRLLTFSADNKQQNQLAQTSRSDPQIHLTTAAGKSAANYLDICDFVQSSVEEEVALVGVGEEEAKGINILVNSGPKNPNLIN